MSTFLYYPVKKPLRINQPFGNPDPKYTGMGLKGHNGIDFGALHGDPIYAAHDGIALYEIDNSGGHGVVLRSTVPENIDGVMTQYKSIYWHMCDPIKEPQYESPIFKAPNKVVQAGDLLGYADNTGLSTGDHLHFGLKPIALNEDNGTWFNAAQANGYFGAIDPQPYFNGFYAEDAQTRITLLRAIVETLKNLISFFSVKK